MFEAYQKFAEVIDRARLIIFDNDGVTFKVTPAINKDCARAAALAAMDLVIGLTFKEACRLGNKSYRKCGSSRQVFVDDFGVSAFDIHEAYHSRLNVNLLPVDKTLPAAFDAFHKPRAMLTQGSRAWVVRSHNRIGIRKAFADKDIFPFEDTHFDPKSISEWPFRHVLDQTGYNAEDSVMIDDSQRNLVFAKATGMSTIHMAGDCDVAFGHHPHVDFVIKDLHPVLSHARGQALEHVRSTQRGIGCSPIIC